MQKVKINQDVRSFRTPCDNEENSGAQTRLREENA